MPKTAVAQKSMPDFLTGWLTTEQVAEGLGVHPYTVQRYGRLRKNPLRRAKLARGYRYRPEWVEAFVTALMKKK